MRGVPTNVRDSAQGSELGVSAPQTRLGRVGCHGGTRVLARCSPPVRPPLRMLEAWPRDAVHVVNTLLRCGILLLKLALFQIESHYSSSCLCPLVSFRGTKDTFLWAQRGRALP